jgi:hypothetical protein
VAVVDGIEGAAEDADHSGLAPWQRTLGLERAAMHGCGRSLGIG